MLLLQSAINKINIQNILKVSWYGIACSCLKTNLNPRTR